MSGCNNQTSNSSGSSNSRSPTDGANQGCPTCTITSQTVVTVPADRSRTTIGVGEDVWLTVSPGPATWSVDGEGVFSSDSGTSVTFRAGRNAGTVVITAVGAGCSCPITFTVIAPSSVSMGRQPDTPIKHTNGRPDCGFLGQLLLQPDTVSFINLEVREKNSHCTADGFFLPFNNCTHQPAGQTESAWFTMNDCIPGKGTPANLNDNIYSGDPGTGPPFTVGTMVFPIDWEYRVWGGPAQALPHFEQRHEVNAAGKCTTSKGGTSVTTNPSDATSSW
jgi:hypothetical protein